MELKSHKQQLEHKQNNELKVSFLHVCVEYVYLQNSQAGIIHFYMQVLSHNISDWMQSKKKVCYRLNWVLSQGK